MADPIVPQVPPAGDPQTPLTTPPGEPAAPQTIDEYKAELAKARDALTAANHEAADRRKKLKAFEDAETKRLAEEQKKKDADLSEV